MKTNFILIALVLFSYNFIIAQTDNRTITEDYDLTKNEINETINSLSKDPENWRNLLEFIENYITKKDTTYGKWLNNLNLEFKTLQNQDSTKSSLGVSYDFKLERGSITEKANLRNGKSISFASKGNVAFNKLVNPYDFLNSKLSVNFFHTLGGVDIKNTNNSLSHYADLRGILSTYKSSDEILNSPEWLEINDKFVLKNSWILKYDLNAGIESNQDFSKSQTTFGLGLGTGLKSWDKNNIASKLNIIDYPFELIRKITKYDGNIHTGITIPSLMFGFDYVNPLKDIIRENLEGELKPFPRINIEIGFRTVLAEVSNETFYFNSSYKYFKEIGASSTLKENNYSDFSYITASLTTSTGLYISYSNGKLPFDLQDDAVYELGFKYKLK
tara:strand:+ start:10727 stop:11887 length:1161 start_codon:yes stop_codon:yes gene_type:complete